MRDFAAIVRHTPEGDQVLAVEIDVQTRVEQVQLRDGPLGATVGVQVTEMKLAEAVTLGPGDSVTFEMPPVTVEVE